MPGMNDIRSAFVRALDDGVTCRSAVMTYAPGGGQVLSFEIQCAKGRHKFNTTCGAAKQTGGLMQDAVALADQVNKWASAGKKDDKK